MAELKRKTTAGKDDAATQAQAALARTYHNLFEGHADGQAILTDLSQKFYDRSSVTSPVDPNATLVMEGQRQVVLYIIQQCAEGQK